MANATAAAGAVSWARFNCCSASTQQTEGNRNGFFGTLLPYDQRRQGRAYPSVRSQAARAAGTPEIPEGWGRTGRLKSQIDKKGQKAASQKEKSLEGWTEVAPSLSVEEGTNKATIHKGEGYVVIKSGDELYGIDANCASCKFPVIEGKVTTAADGKGPQIECPLCHSKFSLLDGTVLEYCPKDGPMQWIVGTIKEKAPRENTKVYPARMSRSGRVYFQFVKPT
ncbi:hypothetical protein KFL_000090750 [Klebsormidium nitens]|uniref:Rieske domain-containing protein n=1 Tax=Klebsormidium nitens TaxID=105231 RepID=A0A1Y1HIB9_KLENI|nr:hypothetical protein KFL_000090750 [Klebsormidium nitens]|eukprot:GAQ78230.1 hypothetical protein KFL_000090750 [Klebsormidium nitens]